MEQESTSELLTHHWAMDTRVAEVLGQQIDYNGQALQLYSSIEGFDVGSIDARDNNRREIGDIYTLESGKILIIVGPCSLDEFTNYDQLFDYIAELQEQYPDTIIALRANSAKPRTAGNWTGLWYTTELEDRAKIMAMYNRALKAKIPIISEVTQETQIGSLAPWMSGFWLGARDKNSTALRTVASAYHLGVGVKNGSDGSVKELENTLKTIRRSSKENDGSGVDLGVIARSPLIPGLGIDTDVLFVGEGNQRVAIFARGHVLSGELPDNKKISQALGHLSSMCLLGEKMDSVVLVDGSHKLTEMLGMDGKDPDRLLPTINHVTQAIKDGKVEASHMIRGLVAEVGSTTGRTDPNFLITGDRKKKLTDAIGEYIETLTNQFEVV